MKRWIKIAGIIFATPVVLVIILGCTYIILNWQGIIEPDQRGDPHARHKLLIASQGSEFKEELVTDLLQRLKSDTVFVSIRDCTSLNEEIKTDWDAILIIHTTQIHGMPEAAMNYLERVPDLSKVVLITTSGGGDETVSEFDVDAISTASRMASVDKIADWTISKVKIILANNI